MPAYRSILFAPGNHARKVMKVFGCGADNVILALEDAVAKAEKVVTGSRYAGPAYSTISSADTWSWATNREARRA